jgi:hypothetical protein
MRRDNHLNINIREERSEDRGWKEPNPSIRTTPWGGLSLLRNEYQELSCA